MIGHNFCAVRLPKEWAGKIRSVEVVKLFVACLLILVGCCLGSSDPARAPQVVAHAEGLSVVVQPSDGTYEIQNGGHSVIHARVAAEIDHKWVQSTHYPKHEISQTNFGMLSDTARKLRSLRPNSRVSLISYVHYDSMMGEVLGLSRQKYKITEAIR
jgi:hypothetical protein